MQQVRDKILIYQWRTLSQRIEAVFGNPKRNVYTSAFVDINTETELVSIHGFVVKPENATKKSEQYFFVNGRYMRHPYFVYSLLAAYEDNDFCLDNATLRMLWPYVRAALLPSLVPASLLVFICLLMYAVPHPLLAVLINVLATPLALFPPVYMIKRRGSVVAFAEAFKMGFSSWFSLAFAIFLVILFGAMMLLSVNMPWMLARLFDAFSSSGEEWWYVMFLRFVAIALTIIGYLSCCMVGSMVQLYCVYHFGHMSHAQGGEESYERSIHNFENL